MIQLRPCDLYHSAGGDGLGAPACMHPEACLNLAKENLTDPNILSDNERKLYEEMEKCALRLRNQLIEVLSRSLGWDKEEENKEFVLPPDRGGPNSECPVQGEDGDGCSGPDEEGSTREGQTV